MLGNVPSHADFCSTVPFARIQSPTARRYGESSGTGEIVLGIDFGSLGDQSSTVNWGFSNRSDVVIPGNPPRVSPLTMKVKLPTIRQSSGTGKPSVTTNERSCLTDITPGT